MSSTLELDLWPAWFCEHCMTQERGRMLWFLNHGICRWNADRITHIAQTGEPK